MQIFKLLQEDKRVQDLIINLSCTLKENQCLFALNIWGAINFKKVKLKHKNKFRRLNWIFNPTFITSIPLTTYQGVRIMGMAIEETKKEEQSIYSNN